MPNRRIILITGASSGIGAATARALAGPGTALLLHARGGTASFAVVAQAAAMPAPRVPGFLSALERLLNVDGYGVLDIDQPAQEVRLNVQVLRDQFLGGAP